MPTLSVSSTAGIDMLQFWPGTSGGTVTDVVTQTTSQFRVTVDLGNGQVYDLFYFGSGFAYDGDTAIAGTYTSVQIRAPGGTAALAILSGLSQPLADIYTLTPDNLVPLAGNDTLTGNSSALSNDILIGGDGNDRITDTVGTRNINGGAGDDLIFIGSTAGSSGTVRGGSGTDTVVSTNLTGVTLSGIEILQTQGANVIGTLANFASFDTIWTFSTAPTATVALTAVATGAATLADLSAALNSGGGPRGVSFTGSTDDETVTSGEGVDTLRGGLGNDSLSSGGGNDRLEGGDGNDTMVGGDGNDTLTDTVGNNTMLGGAGNDTLTSGAGVVSLAGGADDDLVVLAGFGSSGVISGGSGTDTLRFLVSGTDLSLFDISGIEIVDFFGRTLISARADQWMGFDQFIGLSGGYRFILVETGSDTVFNLIRQFDTAGPGGVPVGIEVTGSADNERMTSGNANDTFNAGLGDDTLFGNDGDDLLDGDRGNNLVYGGRGSDIVVGDFGLDTLYGGLGDDFLTNAYERGRDQEMFGGSGNDVFTYISPLGGRTAEGLVNGGAGQDMLSLRDAMGADIRNLKIRGIETLEVIGLDDGFTAGVTAYARQLEAFGKIQDRDNSGTGEVRFFLAATGGEVTLDLAPAFEAGNARELHITGSSDRETIYGSSRIDMLGGGGGNDRLIGRAGDDTLTGGKGNDTLRGGDGSDEFHFSRRDGVDLIEDFDRGLDRIFIDGVKKLGQMTFSNTVGGVQIEARDTTIIVQGLTVNQMRDADNFLFDT